MDIKNAVFDCKFCGQNDRPCEHFIAATAKPETSAPPPDTLTTYLKWRDENRDFIDQKEPDEHIDVTVRFADDYAAHWKAEAERLRSALEKLLPFVERRRVNLKPCPSEACGHESCNLVRNIEAELHRMWGTKK